MKYILTILSLISSVALAAQSNHLLIEEGAIKWQRIYEAAQTAPTIAKALKLDGRFSEVEQLDSSTVVAKLSKYQVDYEKQGYTKMQVPMYLVMETISGSIVIHIKDDKYRVTMNNVKLTQMNDVSVFKQGEVTNLEQYALRASRDSFKGMFLKKAATIIDTDFSTLFELSSHRLDW